MQLMESTCGRRKPYGSKLETVLQGFALIHPKGL